VEGTWDPTTVIAAAIALAAGVPLPTVIDGVAAGQDIAAIALQCQSDPSSCQQTVQAQAAARPAAQQPSDFDQAIVDAAELLVRSAQRVVLDDQESVEFWSQQLQKVSAGPAPYQDRAAIRTTRRSATGSSTRRSTTSSNRCDHRPGPSRLRRPRRGVSGPGCGDCRRGALSLAGIRCING
jgi:predicted secreted protein